ncbi:MAG: hypothetical protein LIP01_08580 [Tannerellaceae bacterium]|nr:hypothetical protein [Tannerellaceae bacterium]
MKKKEKNTKTKKTLQTDDLTLQTLEKDKQVFLIQCLEAGYNLITNVFNEDSPETSTPERLDDLIDKWNKGDLKRFNLPEQTFISLLGALLGHYANREFNGQWIVLTDPYGTDYICQTDINHFEFQFFPFSTVKNAVREPVPGKLSGMIRTIREKLNEK